VHCSENRRSGAARQDRSCGCRQPLFSPPPAMSQAPESAGGWSPLTAIVRRIASFVSPADCRIRLTRAEEARRFLCQHSEPCSETGHTRERRDLIRRIELFRARPFAGWPTDFGSNPRERDRVFPNDVCSVIPGPAQIRGKLDKRIVAIRSDERRIIALGYRFHYQRVTSSVEAWMLPLA
jgi:hypothetical protein